ncbi:MAG: C40 family peptidase [Lachnospiraceae bacterium]|nr:C40 family peptidase [Lachnospiraceae bacterium]
MRKCNHPFRGLLTCLVALTTAFSLAVPASATTISQIKALIKKQQAQINQINTEISDMEDAQDLLEEEIADLDSEILNTMVSVGLLEDEIAANQIEIDKAQAQYDEAKAVEEKQYEDMKLHIQLMYEAGNSSYLEAFLASSGFGAMMNQADYIEAFYAYDQKLLQEYKAQKEYVETLRLELEAQKSILEADKQVMEEEIARLETLLAEKKEKSESYDAQIAKAKQEAAAYKAKIQQEEKEIKKLEEEARKKAEEEARKKAEAAANGNYNVTKIDVSIIDNANGSELGKKIAKYACQYIGNPYVYGGTSLTKGTDCSGFTYRVYKDFGYSLSRTSAAQRNNGKAVEYKDAQPGDLICYDGHVGLYIGGGYIVHASNPKSGIKVSKATYRTILAVRRII